MDNIKVKVKRIDAMDIGALRQMSVAFRDEENAPYPEVDDAQIDKHMLQVLATKDDPRMIYLMAYAGKKPIGFLLGYIGTHEWGTPELVGVGQELYVVPDKRGGKIALKLMERAFEIAIQAGVQGLECVGLYGKTDRKWEKFGFKQHITYGHMPPDQFIQLVQKYTKGSHHGQ
jgi:GNAT superfamily N-acetyltransferase